MSLSVVLMTSTASIRREREQKLIIIGYVVAMNTVTL